MTLPPSRLPRRTLVALCGVVMLAAALRYPAVGFGLPRRDLASDEGTTNRLVEHVLRERTLDTRNYKWPNLNVYVSAAALKAVRTAGPRALRHADAYRVGRSVAATFGVLTVIFVFFAAARLLDPATGLLAAAFLAVMPLHMERSRTWLTDGPMTTFYALALWLSCRALERPSLARIAAAGAVAGLATGTKYNGAAACLLVFLATMLAPGLPGGAAGWTRRAKLLAAGAVSAVAAFFLVNPYALPDWDLLRKHTRLIGRIYTSEPPTGFLGHHALREILENMWQWGVGPWLCALALAGAAILARRRAAAAVLFVVPALLYLVTYSSTLRLPLARNFLPVLPHVAIVAAVAAMAGARALARAARPLVPRSDLTAVLAFASLAVCLPRAVGDLVAVRLSDTRVEALHWIGNRVPVGASVVYEWPMVEIPRARWNARRKPLYEVGYEELAQRADYVVAVSERYEPALRQRDREGFRQRAALYRSIFEWDQFELVARFVPDLSAWGPEVRVYRNRRPVAPELVAGCIDLRRSAIGRSEWRGPFPAGQPNLWRGMGGGALALTEPWNLFAGRTQLAEAGRYELRVAVDSDRPLRLRIGLGGRARRVTAGTGSPAVVAADLPPGLAWWRVENDRRCAPCAASVRAVELCRVEPDAGAPAPPAAALRP